MADITMCRDTTCPMKGRCSRYKRILIDSYDYFIQSPRKRDGTCNMLWSTNTQQIFDGLKEAINGNNKSSDKKAPGDIGEVGKGTKKKNL